MKIQQYMTAKVQTLPPTMRLFDAIDTMEAQGLRRLPVVEEGRLVGLLTEATIAAALPSQATSLSIHETNYLLNKTTVADCMIPRQEVVTTSQDAWLEEGIEKMLAAKVAVLPVVNKNDGIEGIITNNDIFQAFLSLTGFTQPGVRCLLKITEDQPGVLAQVTRHVREQGWDIVQLVVDRSAGYPVIIVQLVAADPQQVQQSFETIGYQVLSVLKTGQEPRT